MFHELHIFSCLMPVLKHYWGPMHPSVVSETKTKTSSYMWHWSVAKKVIIRKFKGPT